MSRTPGSSWKNEPEDRNPAGRSASKSFPECIKVMKAAAVRERLDIEWRPLPIGKKGHEEHGHTLPALTEQALRELDGWIMGPIGHAAYPRGDPTWVMPPVRKKFDLFAAVRPAHAAI